MPFKICVKDPETTHWRDPHAHLMEPGKNGKDKMMRLKLFPAMPRNVADIQDAFPLRGKYLAIPDDYKSYILAWAKKPNKFLPKNSNWEILWAEWCYGK